MKYAHAAFPALIGAFIASTLVACEPTQTSARSNEPDPVAPSVDYVSQQEILVALPMRVRLPAKYRAERVLVFFRTWGSHDWETMELSRSGQSWTGEISCRDVSTVTGDTRYFFLALNDDGEAVVGSGSPEWPHVATVVRSLPEGPSALAGETAPVKCHDPADCPPDFPGCPAYAIARPACFTDHDCRGGRCAWDGYCESMPSAEEAIDRGDEDGDDPNDAEALARAIKRAKRKYKAIAVAHHGLSKAKTSAE